MRRTIGHDHSLVLQSIFCLAAVALPLALSGCYGDWPSSQAVIRPQFLNYQRVAIVANLSRDDEAYFLTAWMAAFPMQTVVERRDLSAIIGEQRILPERLDESTRARIREILGVEAIVYPTVRHVVDGQASPRSGKLKAAVKVIDTETGSITASASASISHTYEWNSKSAVRLVVRAMKREMSK